MPDLTVCSAARRDFLLLHLAPALLAAALLLALEKTIFDSAVSGWFFDPATGGFPLHHNVALEILGHQWPKQVAFVVSLGAISTYLLSFLLAELGPQRRLLLFLSLALTLAPLSVTLLKHFSVRHCPWSLREFGGFAPHLSLFDAAAPGLPGHCFPGGHASAGFCLLAFYFAGLALRNRTLALGGLWSGLASGMALGMVRVAQGAHFISHNLWSGLICWLVILALYTSVMPMAAGVPGEEGS